MQAMVKGRTGYHVEGALVGLVVGVELARRSSGTCRLYVLSRPILGPGEAGIAVGVFLGCGCRRILLVISSLESVVDGSLDGVGRDRGGGDGVYVCSIRLDNLVGHAGDMLARITVFGFIEVIPTIASKLVI